MSVGHQNKKAVEKSVLNYFNSQSIWQSCRRSQIPDEPCMTGVRCSRNHPPRIDDSFSQFEFGLFTDGAREPFELRSEVVVLSRNLNGLASRFAQPAIQLFRGEGYLSDLSNRDQV